MDTQAPERTASLAETLHSIRRAYGSSAARRIRNVMLHVLIGQKTEMFGTGTTVEKSLTHESRVNHLFMTDLSDVNLKGDRREFVSEVIDPNSPKYAALLRSEDNHVNHPTTIVEAHVPRLLAMYTERFNLNANVEIGTSMAKADVVLDGKVILKDVPGHALLQLRKDLKALIVDLRRLPELPRDQTWKWNSQHKFWETAERTVARTQPFNTPVLLNQIPSGQAYPANYKPAVQNVAQTEVLGSIKTQVYSGKMSRPQKDALITIAEKIYKAVQEALREANSVKVEAGEPFKVITDLLLKEFEEASAASRNS